MGTSKPQRPLTAHMERFAQLLFQGYNQTDAYKTAGYSLVNQKQIWEEASKLASNPKVSQRLAELRAPMVKKLIKETTLNKEYVLKQLHENALKASQAIPVLDRKGNPTGEYTYYPNAVNRSYELIGKELEMFHDKPPAPTGDVHNTLVLQGFTVEQLQEMLNRMPAEVRELTAGTEDEPLA